MRLNLLFCCIFLSFGFSCHSGSSHDPSSDKLIIQGRTTVPADYQYAYEELAESEKSTSICSGNPDGICCNSGSDCSPAFLKMTVKKMWVSENADCSQGVFVSSYDADGVEKDLVQNPTLISGSPRAGTYRCIVIKIRDTMTFGPNNAASLGLNAATGMQTCVVGSSYLFDFYTVDDSTQWENYEMGTYMNGAGTISSPVTQDIYLYISTDINAISGGSSRQKISMADPIVISYPGNRVQVSLILNLTNRIMARSQNSGGTKYCWQNQSNFSLSER